MPANLDSTVTVAKDVLFREVAGEAVLLNLVTGKYFGLDAVGTRMWALLAEHGQIAPAYQALLAEYDVNPDQLQHDLLALVDKLSANELLQIMNHES